MRSETPAACAMSWMVVAAMPRCSKSASAASLISVVVAMRRRSRRPVVPAGAPPVVPPALARSAVSLTVPMPSSAFRGSDLPDPPFVS